MSAAAATSFKSPPHSHSHSHSRSQSHNHSHSHSHSRSSRPSTTPRGPPTAISVGQSMPPLLTPNPNLRTPQTSIDPKSPSPSYFGFVVGTDDSIPPDSNPGLHARQNWTFPSSSQSTLPTPRHVPVESNPDFEAFRRQSEHNHRFSLNTSTSSLGRPSQSRTASSGSNLDTPVFPLSKRPHLERSAQTKDASQPQDHPMEGVSLFDFPRQSSPQSFNHPHSVADHQHARLSLPMNGLRTAPAFNTLRQTQRSDTVPPAPETDSSPLCSPVEIGDLLRTNPQDVLVLDLRVYQQYAASRVKGALNLCIPTTLLKRPAYNVQRLADTFTSPHDRCLFEKWETCSHIVVYDANSSLLKDAIAPLNVLKKFKSEGWEGNGWIVKGGFLAFSKLVPDLVDSAPVASGQGASTQPLSISAAGKETLAVAGGCAMPAEKSAANPFFGNIRQNMDLLDGVGQMPIKQPANMSSNTERHLPRWLKQASAKNDEGKAVSERFLKIERYEQKRMQEALSAKVSYGTPRPDRPSRIQVAGIEKGSKNRYNNIFPYDHSRVKLQNVPQGSCDYVNASHIKAELSNRHYIATQAPIPATFDDFWRVVWEQDVRVIVMLTAESEGGQVKCHKYWTPGVYGSLKLKQLSEKRIVLQEKKPSTKSPQTASRPSLGARRSTTANISLEDDKSAAKSTSIVVRHLALSNSSQPFQPLREITQVHYSDWPDLGTPASPSELLALVEQVNKCVRKSSTSNSADTGDVAPKGQRPVLVHCSAGCGRTGTFCTIDSVIDMLKRQQLSDDHGRHDRMDVDSGDDWVSRDDTDLVAKTVDDFRHQRLSMVQNLRQFVLCYESVLQWLASRSTEPPTLKRPGMSDTRRSYQGSYEMRS